MFLSPSAHPRSPPHGLTIAVRFRLFPTQIFRRSLLLATTFSLTLGLGGQPLVFGQSDDSVTSNVEAAVESEVAAEVDFARQILPILSDKCFVCHGPDTNEETDLRLDSFLAASEDRGGYRALDVESPDESELLIRIDSADDPMPPVDAEKQLSDRERELIRRWVRQGGEYAKHWAFERPGKRRAFDSQTEAIDALIGESLSERGIEFAGQADPHVLARRVSLVLTGLPPERKRLDEFLANPTERGYRRLVDQLLDDPRFGEHQARYWLDAVRYGDTHGLHLDNRRGIYPYRDWVVRAMNQNLPLDDFVCWQIAGDLFPDATLSQQIASGFVRLNPSTGEGGAIPAEFQMKNNFDRVETLGTVFLGMSLTCARCHTHKYDPIEQTEYYRLLSFFNSTAEPAMDGNSYTYGPTVRVPADQAAWTRWTEQKKTADQFLASFDGEDLQTLLPYAEQTQGWKTKSWKISKPVSAQGYTVPFSPELQKDWADQGGLPGALSGRAARGKIPGKDQLVWIAFELEVPSSQQMDLTMGGAAGTLVFLDGNNVPRFEKLEQIQSGAAGANEIISLRLSAGSHQVLIGMVGAEGLSELHVDVTTPWDSLARTKSWAQCGQVDRLRMLADPMGPIALSDPAAVEMAEELSAEESNFTTTLVARELPSPRPTHVLRRGEYDMPFGDPVKPGVLSVMGELAEDAPRDRRGLAEWLTAREHPLVARVLVNQIWQRTFGHGLVRTPEDFGLQGEQPTHPELLDWLAVELHDGGWDLKETLRAMVLSRTFRQSSQWRPEIDDPENRLYARGASYRLDAEILRDIGLWSSRLLDPHMGGEGVKPYQPAGMWTALAHPASNTKLYVRDRGEKLYRRSLYVYWKRTSPHPMMTLFDAPDRESSCVRRSRTNTPLQSLGMFNETQRIEMGRGLAARLLEVDGGDAARIEELFRLLACRGPSRPELAACLELLSGQRKRFEASTHDATSLLSVGDAQVKTSEADAELAAWSQLATTVLASDLAILMY